LTGLMALCPGCGHRSHRALHRREAQRHDGL